MATSVTLRLNAANINQLLNSPSGGVARYLIRKGIEVENAAKVLCPVDTGRLRSSIGLSTFPTANGLIVRVGSNVEYAGYVERGTSRMRAQPYLRPALNQVFG